MITFHISTRMSHDIMRRDMMSGLMLRLTRLEFFPFAIIRLTCMKPWINGLFTTTGPCPFSLASKNPHFFAACP